MFDPRMLVDARMQCHHAVQLLTRVARGYIAPRDDDSHTNLGWDHADQALAGHAFNEIQFRLIIPTLTIACGAERLPLIGRTLVEGAVWVRRLLASRGLDIEPFDKPLHFQIPAHPVRNGRPFDAGSDALAELARYYAAADRALCAAVSSAPKASPVRCWPHHFDIGALLPLPRDGQSIGLGMSPGDEYYDQPYYYVNLFPNPDASKLPPLGIGHWHTHQWIGAVLLAAGPENTIRSFLDTAIRTLESI